MGNVLLHIHNFVLKHKIFSITTIAIVVFASVFSITRLRFNEDVSRFFPDSGNSAQLRYIMNESTLMNKIIFTIHKDYDSTSVEQLVDFSNDLISILEADSIRTLLSNQRYGISESDLMSVMDIVRNNLPLFLDSSDYEEIDRKLQPDSIKNTVDAGYKSLLSPIGFVSSQFFLEDPFNLSGMGLKKVDAFNFSKDFTTYKGHIFNTEKSDMFLFANLKKGNSPEANRYFFDVISKHLKELKQEKIYAGIEPYVLSGTLVALQNEDRIKKDVTITVSLTILLLLLLVWYFFRKRRALFIIFLPTLLGSVVALGTLSLFSKEISLMSLGIGAILMGMTVDYSLHIYSHYRQYGSIKKMLMQVSSPIILSTITTMSAFYVLNLVRSQVLSDLGIFSALSIFFAAIFALTLLPVLIKTDKNPEPGNTFFDSLSNSKIYDNKRLRLLLFILTGIFLVVGGNVPFDSDMMKSNYISKETAIAENHTSKFVEQTSDNLYIITHGKNLDSVLKSNSEVNFLLDSLKEKGVINNYLSVNNLIKPNAEQEKKIADWKDYWSEKFGKTRTELESEAAIVGLKNNAFKKFYHLVEKDYHNLSETDREKLLDLLFSDFIVRNDSMIAAISVVKVDEIEAAKSIIDAGLHSNSWSYNSRAFVNNLILGIKNSFSNIVYISLIVVFMILLLYFGRIELTLITMVPILFGFIWIEGIMSLLNMNYNIFNIIVLSFIFGLGIDYGIFITKGVLQKYAYNQAVVVEYRVSILLSYLTTTIGMGSLILAKHPALHSIAIMAIIGISSTLLIAYTIQPALLKFLLYNKGEKRKSPVTLTDFIFSLLGLTEFVLGAVFLSLTAVIFRIIPVAIKTKKIWFHILLQKFAKGILYLHPVSSKKIINEHGEDFRKPAVIIANHQSHIDIMMILLLHPKILILTNDRNWNNKLFGFIIKYADFLPVSIHHEELINKLRPKVSEGYSIMIFPEGTRSADGVLKPFHRGAFLLARELNLEILPVILHGIGTMLSKEEFFVHKGHILIKVLPRLTINSGDYGKSLLKQSRNVFRYFSSEYNKLRKEIETPGYYRNTVLSSYLFRSPQIEWYMKIKIRMEDNYTYYHNLIPMEATISDLGCGYGFLIHTLAQCSEQRKFVGVDFDCDKIAVAKNNALTNNKTRFYCCDLTDYEPEESDVFILNDVLHYLSAKDRSDLLRKVYSKMNNNGSIVIRDGDKDLKHKHKITELSEVISTSIKFNKANFRDLDFLSRQEIISLTKELGAHLEIADNTRYTSNITYIIRKEPDE
ncbi:1-acyl-sn-glycerol-3-phosphate acyltransferase [Maribellus mangrovi]|uniref:1-acyl-sn-glycerol-3-phosphate acyltransferase n=1 Tax=Maribellus mangrovi TaxID=3133146 RepID=UPI0030EE5A15